MTRAATALLGALLAVSGVACTAGPNAAQPPPQLAVEPAPMPTAAVAEVERAFQDLLGATDIHGLPMRPSTESVTVVVMFATWCGACRRELGWLGELHQELGFEVIGVNCFDQSEEAQLRAFQRQMAPFLRVIRADSSMLETLGDPQYVPTTYVFDTGGRLINAYVPPERHPPTKEEMRAAILALISG